MDAKREERIEELLNAALDREPAQRRAYLAQECADDDTQLLAEVESLLQHHDATTAAKFGPPAWDQIAGDFCNTSSAQRTDASARGPHEASSVPAPAGYEVLDELGRGGMGVVYKARQVKLKRLVALKMILAGRHAGPGEVARFRTEAEAIARLRHPNIVQVYEVGEHEGQPFFSLEYMEGGSLGRALAGAPQVPRTAAKLVETLARAIHHAHQKGIIHRDLKPANILLASPAPRSLTGADEGKTVDDNHPWAAGCGDVKITDFGLAKELESHVGQTQSGAVMGTPSYMAPEQAQGKSKYLGPAVDIYALGAILYELLTGRPPFRGPTPLETMMQAVEDEPVAPGRLQPKVPRDLETICLKCLRKEPAKRYASAASLADDLERFQKGEPVHAHPVGQVERFRRWCRRNPMVASLVGLVALVTVIGVAAVLHQLNRALSAESAERKRADELENAFKRVSEAEQNEKKKAHDLQDALEEVSKQKKTADDNWTRSEWKVYAANISQAQLLWQDNNVAGAHDFLNACRRDFRGWEHDYLWTLFNSNQQTFHGHTDAVSSVAFSPDGKRIASSNGDQTVKLWDAATGENTLTLKAHTRPVMSVAFSPDGQRIVSGSADETVKVWDAASGQYALTLKGHTGVVTSVAFSPDSKRIVSGSYDKTVKVWDAATGQDSLTLKDHTGLVFSVAFAPDGKRIVSGSADQTAKVWDAATGQETLTFRGHTSVVLGVAFSPDGKRIVSTAGTVTGGVERGYDQTVKVWDAATGHNSVTLEAQTGVVRNVAFSPNGKSIVGASEDRTVRIWDAATGQVTLTLRGHTRVVTRVGVSLDGQRIVSGSADKTVKVWDAATSQGPRTLKGHTRAVGIVAFSPDGKHIISGSTDQTLKVWNATTGENIRTIKRQFALVGNMVAFSPDGKCIVSGSGREHNTVKVWDVATGQDYLTFKGHTSRVRSVAFTPDGKRLVTSSDDQTLKVWDVTTGQATLTLNGHAGVWSVAFSPDGNRIVCAGNDGTVKIWDALIGQHTLILKVHSGLVSSVAFSPDGKRIVSSSHDQTVKVWDAATGQDALTLKGHTSVVIRVAFSPDGKRIVSGSGDKTVKVWDAATGQETLTLTGHTDPVGSVAFSPDGKRIASGSHDQTIKVWDAMRSQGKGF